jgi:hypothetical protein
MYRFAEKRLRDEIDVTVGGAVHVESSLFYTHSLQAPGFMSTLEPEK